jgi:hypothetical protein
MRTTLTLDDDVAALLRKEMTREGLTLKDAVNEALRRGLVAARPAPRKRYRVRLFKTGAARIPIDNIAEALAHAEGEGFR